MRSHRRTAGAVIAAAAVVSFGCGAGAAPIPLPLVAGNFSIAQQFLHGDAHVVVLGDSEQNGLVATYPARWHVDQWSGIVGGPNLTATFTGDTGVYDFHFPGNPAVASVNNFTADQAGSVAGPGIAPGATMQLTFNAVTTPPAITNLDNRVYSVSLSPNQTTTFYSGKWADTSSGMLHADVLYYANPTGIASGLELDARINSITTAAASTPINARSATPGGQVAHQTFPAQAWQNGNTLSADFRLLPGSTPDAGSNLVIAGVRFYNDTGGFQMANVAFGSKGVDYFLDPANDSDANLATYLNFTDSNIAYIWLGQNDPGKYDPAQWKTKMVSLVDRYEAAKPGMKFVLVSTYDTGDPTLAGYAQDLYDISQTDPNVLFLNLYESAGTYNFLDANYLLDHVHENAAGLTYFADQTQSLLAMAASQAPEPAGLSLLAVSGLALLGRRRRAA
jgi:hypothetical protein